MISLLTRVGFIALFAGNIVFGGDFPRTPNEQKTPGSLCDRPVERRYSEKIKYCGRNVSVELKNEIIREYDKDLGFRVSEMDRGEFKIDHLIPLCAGGSNEKSNLWPQHRTIYELTDALEGELCAHMSLGLMSQKDAVEIIKFVKTVPEKGPAEFDRLNRLRN